MSAMAATKGKCDTQKCWCQDSRDTLSVVKTDRPKARCAVTSELEALERAKAFDLHDVVARYCADNGTPLEEGQRRMHELLRFLAVCAVADEPIGMAGPIDELWHTFLLFTRDYELFCQAVAGRFIHHVPNTANSAPDCYINCYPPRANELSPLGALSVAAQKRSSDDAHSNRAEGTIGAYKHFLELYRSAFGQPPVDLWPDAAADCTGTGDCSSRCSGGGHKCDAW